MKDLRDQDLFVATEAAIAIYDKPIDAALPALADVLGQKRSLPFAMARRAMHAANRLGGAARYAAVLDRFVLASGAESDRLRGTEEPEGRRTETDGNSPSPYPSPSLG